MDTIRVRVFRLDGQVCDVDGVESLVLCDVPTTETQPWPDWVLLKRTLFLVAPNVLAFVATPGGVLPPQTERP